MRQIRLHFRLVPPPGVPDPIADALWHIQSGVGDWIDAQVASCQLAFSKVIGDDTDGQLEIVNADDSKNADFPSKALVISCNGGSLTNDQILLFKDRDGLAGNDILVVVAAASGSAFDGCAEHPPDQPGVILFADTQDSEWLLAHELGHIFMGPDHFNSSNNLMCSSTRGIPSFPGFIPELDANQIQQILATSRAMNQ